MGCSSSKEQKSFSLKYEKKVTGCRQDLFLGKGTFGKVVLVEERKTRETRALKEVKKTQRNLGEIEIMRKLPKDHPNILGLCDTFETSGRILIVLELACGGDLMSWLKQEEPSSATAASALAQISRALETMHSLSIAHRDIKPENVLLVDRLGFHLKVADFGCSKHLMKGEKMKSFVGTKAYAAPEILRGDRDYDFSCDIYSLGILLAFLLTGKHPFSEVALDTCLALASRDVTHLVQFDDSCWNFVDREAVKLVKRLADTRPSKRPTPTQILDVPWIRDREAARLDRNPLDRDVVERLREVRCDDLQKLVVRLMARAEEESLVVESIKEADELFDRLDGDRTGLIRRTELRRNYAKIISTRSIDIAFDNADLDKSGVVSREELRASLLASQNKLLASLVDLTFAKMDVSNTGSISVRDVQNVAKQVFHRTLDSGVVEALLKPHSEDGLLDRRQFREMVLKVVG